MSDRIKAATFISKRDEILNPFSDHLKRFQLKKCIFQGFQVPDLRAAVRRRRVVAEVRLHVRSRRRPQILRRVTPSAERRQRRRRSRPQSSAAESRCRILSLSGLRMGPIS